MKGIHSLLSTLILFLPLGSLQPEVLFAKDPDIKPEDLVANHLKYSKRKIEGPQLHEITYSPKSRGGTLQLRIKLFFNLETFRHVMTEYKYYYSGIELLFREQSNYLTKLN